MFRFLLEAIRNEATERGAIEPHRGTQARRKYTKQGTSRWLRRKTKKELAQLGPEKEPKLPRRTTKGYST